MKSFALAAIAAVVSAQAGKISVDPSTRNIVDEHGRAILFHGVNAVYKVAPFIPTITGPWTPNDSLNAQDIEYMKEWGFNFVRLGVMWEAVEQ
jgi:endoglycosylceramidase